MNISIKFISKKFNNRKRLIQIIFDDYIIEEEIHLNYWKFSFYQYQWREDIKRIKHENESCLIRNIQYHHPNIICINYFSLYKVGPIIIILENTLEGDALKKVLKKDPLFIPQYAYDIIPKMVINEDTPRWIVDA